MSNLIVWNLSLQSYYAEALVLEPSATLISCKSIGIELLCSFFGTRTDSLGLVLLLLALLQLPLLASRAATGTSYDIKVDQQPVELFNASMQ